MTQLHNFDASTILFQTIGNIHSNKWTSIRQAETELCKAGVSQKTIAQVVYVVQYWDNEEDLQPIPEKHLEWINDVRKRYGVELIQHRQLYVGLNKPQLFLFAAASGSGKSTATKRLMLENDGMLVFSYDNLRHEWYDPKDYDNAWLLSTKDKSFDTKAKYYFQNQLKTKQPIICDNAITSAKSRMRLIRKGKDYGYSSNLIVIPIDVDVIVARQKTRPDKTVAQSIVRNQYNQIQYSSLRDVDNIFIPSGENIWE